MATPNQQDKRDTRARSDQSMILMLQHLQRITPPPTQGASTRRFRPRSTRSARSPRPASSIRRTRSRRVHPPALSATRSSGRRFGNNLFWLPSQVTEAQLSDPATRIVLNTPDMTLIACAVNGGTTYYFGVRPCRRSRAQW
ncbi:hypothetical protein FALBO_11749 [Fusarium albosuccineum]|uniref:Uncharacterized protein n=1 Tax=Fusarium albosuccineum TaxID=1237068 RepID=A0A8H4L1R3_9HYPO|nr:hypothetical protein FALBO_11749 [Fusarium albosuccineum]